MGSVAGNMVGKRFGRLAVVEKAPSIRRKGHGGVYAMWMCRCDCGSEKSVRGSHLRSGAIWSCGCASKERIASASRTHGLSKTPEYRTWAAIKRRCHNPRQPGYKQYGALGIRVCERWRSSFEAFFFDMGRKPPGTTIDRIDGSKGYEPGNCRWTTPKEQVYNKRDGAGVRPIGPYRSIAEASEATGLTIGTLYSRLVRGWTDEEALSTPISGQRKLS